MSTKNLIYGVVVNGFLYSNKIEKRIGNDTPNGIYSLDMDADDFFETLEPADITEARKFFSKASKIVVFRGISFGNGIIPENPIKFTHIPIKVQDALFDDFEEVEVVCIRNKTVYYLQTLMTDKMYALMGLQEAIQSDKKIDLSTLVGLTPEMRVVYTFHLLEKKQEAMEKKRKEMAEPINYITAVMSEGGATVQNVKKVNRGFEINWTLEGHKINTLINDKFRVIESGFCTTGHDTTQSVQSVVKLLKSYHEDDPYSIHIFRGYDDEW